MSEIKYEVIGISDNLHQDKVGGPFTEHPTEEVVARFTSLDKAKKFIKKCKLKKERHESFYGPVKFKKNSLLGYYNHAEIGTYHVEPEIPVDPEI